MKKTLALAILLSAAALPAAAQTPEDCFQATLKTDDQAIIRVCTQALDRGGLNDRTRSITLSNRGLGYLRSKDFDKSIIDFSEALLIDPKNAFSFNFRHSEAFAISFGREPSAYVLGLWVKAPHCKGKENGSFRCLKSLYRPLVFTKRRAFRERARLVEADSPNERKSVQ